LALNLLDKSGPQWCGGGGSEDGWQWRDGGGSDAGENGSSWRE